MVGTVNIQRNDQGELQGLKFVSPAGGGDCAAFALALFFADNILALEKQKDHKGIKRIVALFAEHMGFDPEQFTYDDLKAYLQTYRQKESIELLLWQPMVKFLTECEFEGKANPEEQLAVFQKQFDELELPSILDNDTGLSEALYNQLKTSKDDPTAFRKIYEEFSKKQHSSANALLAVKAEDNEGYAIENTIKMIVTDSLDYEEFRIRLKRLLLDGKEDLCKSALKILQNYGFDRNPAIVSEYLPIHVCNVTAENPNSPVKIKEHNALAADKPTLYFAHSNDFTDQASVVANHWHLYASTEAADLGATDAKAPPEFFPLLAANKRSEYFTKPIHLPLPKSVQEKVDANHLTFTPPEAYTPPEMPKEPKTEVKQSDKGAGHYQGMPTKFKLDDPSIQAALTKLNYKQATDGRWILAMNDDGEISWSSEGLSTTSKALQEGNEQGMKVAQKMVQDYIEVMKAQGLDPKKTKANITSDSAMAKQMLAHFFKQAGIATNLEQQNRTDIKAETAQEVAANPKAAEPVVGAKAPSPGLSRMDDVD